MNGLINNRISLLQRTLYALQQLRLHRFCLKNAINNSTKQSTALLTDVDPVALKKSGITVLVLDFDGVLATHGEIKPTPAMQKWLHAAIEQFGVKRVFLLSNKPMPARIAWFADHYPGLDCVIATHKKPYPNGLLQIAQQSQQPPEKILLVDDRLLTGVLAACIAKTQVIWVSQPLSNFRKRPVKELFFASLRKIDRWLIVLVCWK